MPSGIYHRTQEQIKKAMINLAKGRGEEARKKATEKLIKIASDPAWRNKVSDATKRAMWKPEIRKRHLRGLKRAFKKFGINFRGGNGQIPVRVVRRLARVLEPKGFIREFVIPTKYGHNTPGIPNNYKVDFGNPQKKMAIEVDGPSHHSPERQELDKKKTKILEDLGWSVLRIKQ